jgi:hypothetical protein
MPAQVDGNAAEILFTASQRAHLLGQGVEVLWGTPVAVVPTQEAALHSTATEILVTAGDEAHVVGSQAEVLWLDLTFQLDLPASGVEVLWGIPGTVPTQEAALHSAATEILYTAPDAVQFLGSQAEMLVSYDTAVAAVSNISGPSATLATFDGTTSIGFIENYKWNWVTVPVGSLLTNAAVPYPNLGGTSPINMTSNVLLYHAEEVAGTSGFDTSGSGNTASLTAITVGVSAQVGTYAWEFTGVASKAQPTIPVVVGSSWTIAFWFFGLAPNTAFRSGARGASEVHVAVEISGDRLGVFSGGAFRPLNTGFTMSAGAYAGWHHMAAVGGSTGNTTFYVDGVDVGTVVGFRPTDVVRTIGNFQGDNQRFADRLDEIAIWTRSLSAEEIRDIQILQSGFFAGVGPMFTFLPDEDGTYTINLTVKDGINGNLTVDTADAVIGGGGGIKFPLQGDSIRMWSHLQGQPLRRRDEN